VWKLNVARDRNQWHLGKAKLILKELNQKALQEHFHHQPLL
jgi:hypothetical protein